MGNGLKVRYRYGTVVSTHPFLVQSIDLHALYRLSVQRDYGTVPLYLYWDRYNCTIVQLYGTVVKVLNLLRIYVIQYNVFEQFKIYVRYICRKQT